MASREERLSWYGVDEPQPEALRLIAGLLSVDLVAGNLRDICFDGVEIIRAIGYIVRDRDWGTYAPVLSNLLVDQQAASFRVSNEARCVSPTGETLEYLAAIVGRSDGSVRFEVEAEPVGDFLTNRCGFCVLHPIIGLAGRR
jgi:hypothetical protein